MEFSKDFMELSEYAKSMLDDAGTDEWIDRELMHAGVLKPVPEPLVEVPVMNVAKEQMYGVTVRFGASKSDLSLLFSSVDSAQRVVDIINNECAYREGYRYINGEGFSIVDEMATAEITAIPAISRRRFDVIEFGLLQAEKIESENKTRAKNNRIQVEAYELIRDGVVDEIHRCKTVAERMELLYDTFEKYLTMTNDDRSIALKFMREAFKEEEVEKFLEWHSIKVVRDEGGDE